MVNTPGWAVELDGDRVDLGDLRLLLPPPFDPWIEDYPTDDGPRQILRSKTWSGITEVSVIYADARRIVERLNGMLLLIHSDAKAVRPGKALSFGADGNRLNIMYPVSASVNITLGNVRARGRAATGDAPKTPSEGRLQKWFREAEKDGHRADLFSHLTRADNWFDLYKSMEIVRRLAGGEKKLGSMLDGEKKQWEIMWRTANCYRHAPDPIKFALPAPAPQFDTARQFVLQQISNVLSKLP